MVFEREETGWTGTKSELVRSMRSTKWAWRRGRTSWGAWRFWTEGSHDLVGDVGFFLVEIIKDLTELNIIVTNAFIPKIKLCSFQR